jgi:uncharacterized protein (TIGR02594 family)
MEIKHFVTAMSQYGIQEKPGIEDNPEILKYFDALGYDGLRLKDETAWCAAFMNWCLMEAGHHGTGKLYAMSFLNVGSEVEGEPQLGDIVVLYRGRMGDTIAGTDIQKGHVGIFVNQDPTDPGRIAILGGNQSNRVKISKYPMERVLSIRRL